MDEIEINWTTLDRVEMEWFELDWLVLHFIGLDEFVVCWIYNHLPIGTSVALHPPPPCLDNLGRTSYSCHHNQLRQSLPLPPSISTTSMVLLPYTHPQILLTDINLPSNHFLHYHMPTQAYIALPLPPRVINLTSMFWLSCSHPKHCMHTLTCLQITSYTTMCQLNLTCHCC